MVPCQQERDAKLMEKATNGPLSTRVRCQVNGEDYKWSLINEIEMSS